MLLSMCRYSIKKEVQLLPPALLGYFFAASTGSVCIFYRGAGEGTELFCVTLHYIYGRNGSILFPPVASYTYCLESCTLESAWRVPLIGKYNGNL